MVSFFYDLLQHLAYLVTGLIRHFSPKLNAWWLGRKSVMNEVQKRDEGCIWFHLASLGEYEQAKAVIDAMANKFGPTNILLTFFSPSGYEQLVNQLPYSIHYLPLDTKYNAKKWIDTIQPRMVIFTKYDLWYQMITTARERGIPRVLISAIIEPRKYYFKWYGLWMKRELERFDKIYVQSHEDESLGLEFNLPVEWAGDTRMDRSLELTEEEYTNSFIEAWAQKRKIIIAASTHPEDEPILRSLHEKCPPDWAVLVAPHNIDTNSIDSLKKLFPQAIALKDKNVKIDATQTLILDSMGQLKFLYRYASLVYMGGGFGSGIHNILEPMSYGLPLMFGPRYKEFPEARHAVRNGWAVKIERSNATDQIEQFYAQTGTPVMRREMRQWMEQASGASKRVSNWIISQLGE